MIKYQVFHSSWASGYLGICVAKPVDEVASFSLPTNINQPEIIKTHAFDLVFLGIIAKLVLFFIYDVLKYVFNDHFVFTAWDMYHSHCYMLLLAFTTL